MEKYLYFMEQTDGAFDGANDAVCRPVSAFKGFGIIASTTTLELHFDNLLENAGAHAGAIDKVALTVTANKQKEVMEAIADKIKFGKDPFIVVCDSSNNVFIHQDVTACTISVQAAS
mgnify:CR=1 FL=1|tara:strand:+ start:770 stop:1120 length:351 start_codon:yes stop_codon:yes gene_type:complete